MINISINFKSAAILTAVSIGIMNGLSFAQEPSGNSSFKSNYESSQSSHYQSSQAQGHTNRHSFVSYYYPPYQVERDNPIQVQFYSPNAKTVSIGIKNMATNQNFSYSLTLSQDSKLWVGEIPSSSFNRSEELEISYIPRDKARNIIEDQAQTTRYITLNTPSYYQSSNTSVSELRIVSFQKDASSSPVFNVYWPELYYMNKPSFPLAARVLSSRSPENNIQKLDPVKNMPGWFELEVSTLWFSPGEEITIEFSSKDTQKSKNNANYVLGSNADFVPQQTLQFVTLKN